MLKKLLLICVLISCMKCSSIPDMEIANSELIEYKEGGGKQFQISKESEEGEKGEKGYSGQHFEEKGAKGHHDSEGTKKEYAEEGGDKKGYSDKNGYYSQKHKAEKGENGYDYAEKGSYAKGHSTKGKHNIHKLDEFKKRTDFFDEDHDEAYKEKHGGYEQKHSTNSGGHAKGGHYKDVYLGTVYGKKGLSEDGSHFFEKAGFKKLLGKDSHFKNDAEFGKYGDIEAFKKYGYYHDD